jgi:EAL domain-containing protein (putative c-di-GMP-specific phosphodiesterase class I)
MGDAKVSNIVAATISLASTLDLKAIAEVVETAEQLAHLQELGCELAQGNFISEPLAVEAASALLATGN